MATYLMMIAIMSIIHRQWVDYNRLTFPLLQLPLDMTEEERDGSIFNAFLKSPLMWLGFSIPSIIFSTNALNHYFPFVPPIRLRNSLPLFNHALVLKTNVNFIAIGLAYFLSLDVGLGIWLFNLVTKV